MRNIIFPAPCREKSKYLIFCAVPHLLISCSSQSQTHFQRSEVQFIPTSPALESSPQPSLTTSLSAITPHYFESNYKCDCGFEPSGKEINKKSNLKRHRKKSCRRYSPYSGSEKPHECPYRDCGRRFTRSDNLLVHRRNKGHFESFELGIDVSSPGSGSETMPNLFSEDHNTAAWDFCTGRDWGEMAI
jgi:uncharacterized Zn-finger protein